MAHYVYLNENNVVIDAIVGPEEGTEPEGVVSWEEYFTSKGNGVAVRSSYNTHGGVHYTSDGEGGRIPSEDQTKAFRKNYAGIGYTYDEERDAFIPPQPYKSWVLNEDTCLWEAPIPHPEDGGKYFWNEESISWQSIPTE
jgi:hypothetical protein